MGACSSVNEVPRAASSPEQRPTSIADCPIVRKLESMKLFSTVPFKTDYRMLKGDEYELGSGAFSVVRLAEERKTGRRVAVKTLVKDWMKCVDHRALIHEVETLAQLNHENVVQLLDFRENDDFYFVVQEHCSGGTLCDRLARNPQYSEAVPQDIIRTLANALKYVHDKGIIHRDLKPDNILMLTEEDDAPVKIVDFGLSATTKRDEVHATPVGTPNFVAPEVITGAGYGTAVDVWALGAIMYSLLAGYPPFMAPSQRQLFDKIAAGEFAFHKKYWANVSLDAKDLITKILVVDPERRFSLDQILAHPWLATSNTSTLQSNMLNDSRLAQLSQLSTRRRISTRNSRTRKLDPLLSPGSSGGSSGDTTASGGSSTAMTSSTGGSAGSSVASAVSPARALKAEFARQAAAPAASPITSA